MKLAWQQIPSTMISDILCQNSLDGVVIDTEHSCFNPETLFACIQVITLNKKKCFVRLTEVNKTVIRQCLDAGATGLIFSMIECQKQADKVKECAIFPEKGGARGLGLVRENLWGISKKIISDPPLLIAQIETKLGVDNLQFIKEHNIFDYFMIGPYDLSASLGFPEDFNNPLFIEGVEKIKNIIGVEKMAVHIPKNIKKELKKYKNFSIIAVGMDTTFLIEKYKEVEKYA